MRKQCKTDIKFCFYFQFLKPTLIKTTSGSVSIKFWKIYLKNVQILVWNWGGEDDDICASSVEKLSNFKTILID